MPCSVPGLDLRQRVGDLIPQEIDLPGQEIGDRRRRPAIGHDRRFEAEHIAHHHGAQVAVGPDAAMREVRFRALLLDPRDVVLRAGAGNRLAADQQHRRVVDEADRLEGRLRVVAQIGEQARRRQQRDVIDQDGGAVGRRTGHAIVGNRAAAANLVLDDDGPAERARHLIADQARHGVRAAAGRVRNHQRDGFGERLRLGAPRQRGGQETDARQRTPAQPIDHGSLPPIFCSIATPHPEGRSISAKLCRREPRGNRVTSAHAHRRADEPRWRRNFTVQSRCLGGAMRIAVAGIAGLKVIALLSIAIPIPTPASAQLNVVVPTRSGARPARTIARGESGRTLPPATATTMARCGARRPRICAAGGAFRTGDPALDSKPHGPKIKLRTGPKTTLILSAPAR